MNILTEVEIARLWAAYKQLEQDADTEQERACWQLARTLTFVALGTAMRRGQLLAGVAGEPSQPGLGQRQQPGQPAGGDRCPQAVGQQFRGPGDREMLPGQQVGRQRGHPGAVAGRRGRLGGEGRAGGLPAGTPAGLDPMLGDLHPDRW